MSRQLCRRFFPNFIKQLLKLEPKETYISLNNQYLDIEHSQNSNMNKIHRGHFPMRKSLLSIITDENDSRRIRKETLSPDDVENLHNYFDLMKSISDKRIPTTRGTMLTSDYFHNIEKNIILSYNTDEPLHNKHFHIDESVHPQIKTLEHSRKVLVDFYDSFPIALNVEPIFSCAINRLTDMLLPYTLEQSFLRISLE